MLKIFAGNHCNSKILNKRVDQRKMVLKWPLSKEFFKYPLISEVIFQKHRTTRLWFKIFAMFSMQSGLPAPVLAIVEQVCPVFHTTDWSPLKRVNSMNWWSVNLQVYKCSGDRQTDDLWKWNVFLEVQTFGKLRDCTLQHRYSLNRKLFGYYQNLSLTHYTTVKLFNFRTQSFTDRKHRFRNGQKRQSIKLF